MQVGKLTLREAMHQPELHLAAKILRAYRESVKSSLPPEHWQRLTRLKRAAVDADDQITAKAVWCLETVGRIQDHFVSAFGHIKSEECEEAWPLLERCETEIGFLDSHFHEEPGEFGVEHARVYAKRFQSLYLLKWGISPAFLYKDVHCSICDAKITLRRRCEHSVGEIYNGEMCAMEVKNLDMLHIALVDNPVQKYSIIFPHGNDDDRLALVKYVGRILDSPWHGWSYHKEVRREYHPVFKNVGRNDSCPCGSDLKYKRCCLGKEAQFPHFEFSFEKEPLGEFPSLEIHTARTR